MQIFHGILDKRRKSGSLQFKTPLYEQNYDAFVTTHRGSTLAVASSMTIILLHLRIALARQKSWRWPMLTFDPPSRISESSASGSVSTIGFNCTWCNMTTMLELSKFYQKIIHFLIKTDYIYLENNLLYGKSMKFTYGF